ncbi:MAG: heme-copper oxidase subunit III [Gemmatimonas sp.]|nr:heme-copper oxidase subunit III [Gemmatimonas sp.]
MSSSRFADRPALLGVLLFVTSETAFFALLIVTYVHFFGQSSTAAMARAHLDPFRTGIFSLFLFSSSFAVWRAERTGRANRIGRRRFWLAATIALGIVFLAGQVLEYAGILRSGLGLGSNLFTSTFFTLTGFHAAHVLVGLVMLSILLGLDLANATNARSGAQQSVSIYWHFVDGVWVVIFAIVYVLTFRGIIG